MANEYAVNQADLAAVADAIRAKGGTPDALAFPDGFVDAVGAIQTGGMDYLEMLLNNTLTDYSNDSVTTIRNSAFLNCTNLVSVSFKNAIKIELSAFSGCTSLSHAEFPACTLVMGSSFYSCSSLTEINFPALRGAAIGGYAMKNCTNLKKADLGENLTIMYEQAFYGCTSLDTLILRSKSVCSINATNTLFGTPIESGTGYVYVPRALVEEYKAATNWAAYVDQIRAIEDYPEITGG